MLRQLRSDLRSERGETFVELVVSTVLLGILGIGMITALSGAIVVSHADRGFAGTETVLRSFATTLERRPYKACTPGSSANPYSASDLAFTAPNGYTTSVTSVKFLTNKNSNNVTSGFATTCPTAANGGDQGVQQLTVRAVRTDGTAAQTVDILLRRRRVMSHRTAVGRSREGGFTMVELVISVAILGIMSIALGVVGTVMFRTLSQTQDRLTESRGPRFASVHWVPDVSSAERVNPVSAPTICGAAGPLVTLQWTDDRTAVTTVSYAIVTSGGKSNLVRRLCTNGTAVPIRTTTIAPNIATSGGATVTCASGTTFTPCSTPDTDRSLLLTITPKNGGAFSVDAIREVT